MSIPKIKESKYSKIAFVGKMFFILSCSSIPRWLYADRASDESVWQIVDTFLFGGWTEIVERGKGSTKNVSVFFNLWEIFSKSQLTFKLKHWSDYLLPCTLCSLSSPCNVDVKHWLPRTPFALWSLLDSDLVSVQRSSVQVNGVMLA